MGSAGLNHGVSGASVQHAYYWWPLFRDHNGPGRDVPYQIWHVFGTKYVGSRYSFDPSRRLWTYYASVSVWNSVTAAHPSRGDSAVIPHLWHFGKTHPVF